MRIRNLLSATALVGILSALPVAAHAQTSTQSKPAPDKAGEPEEEIVVTGSRIRLPNVGSPQPITTLNQAYLQDRGLTNIADALNELPGIRGSVSPAGAQGSFGQGVNFINVFNLGSNRTLTLVNGRRYVSSNVNTIFNQGSAGVQVDVNVIPTLLVSSVDIISTGGAPVYGSDAIAGTVNYHLDSRLKGVLASATAGVTEQGDAFRYNAAIAGGFNFAEGRGNITVAYTRDFQDGLLYNSRAFLRANIGNGTNPSTAQAAALGRPVGTTFQNDGRLNTAIGYNDSGTDGFPGSVLIRDRTIPLLTGGGLITATTSGTAFTGGTNVAAATQNYQFDISGNLVPFSRGIRFVGATEASGGNGFRFNDYSQITSQLKRDVLNGFASFKFSDALELFAEGTYFHSRGDQLVKQPTFNSSLFGGLSGPLTFDVSSPFLTTQARSQLVALGVNRFQISRASLDLADLSGYSTNDLYRVVAGAKGKFSAIGREFNYEISGNYGRVDIVDSGQDLNAQNFINAVNVTTVGGKTVCTATPAFQSAPGGTAIADAACVPLNLLGEGLSDPAARAYVISDNVTRSRLQQYVFNANIGTSPFELFGNQTGLNVGYEHREEFGSFTPSAFQQAGLGRSVAIKPVSGNYKVNEVFGEAILPVVTASNNVPFIHSLEVRGSGRYVDNTVNGGFFSWSGGIQYAPVKDITFRGQYTRSFRAPAITELFSPRAAVFSSVPDLCSPGNRIAGAVPATRTANCTAFLTKFPNATPLDAAAATVPGLNGGNPNLKNEVAYSFSYGVVLQPRFIPGLTVSVDYVNIKIRNPIASLTVAQIASGCFDNPTFNTADPANGNAFCSQIKRYAVGQGGTAANGGDRGGQVIADAANPGVSSGFVNGNRVFFDGIQASVDYLRPLSGLGIPGRAGFDGLLYFVRTRISDITGIAPVRTDGTLGDPTWQAQLNLRYVGDKVGATVSLNYTGEQLFSRVSRGPDIRELDKLDGYVIINPSIYFNIDKRYRLTFSVSNLLNREGQNYFGIIHPSSYTTDGQLGRRFAVGIRGKF